MNNWLDIKTNAPVAVNTILLVFIDRLDPDFLARNIDLEIRVGINAPVVGNSAVNTICRNSPT